jgi:molecular chaperone GrpE (heat shock protein)
VAEVPAVGFSPELHLLLGTFAVTLIAVALGVFVSLRWFSGSQAGRNSQTRVSKSDAPPTIVAFLASIDDVRSKLDDMEAAFQAITAKAIERQHLAEVDTSRLVEELCLISDHLEEPGQYDTTGDACSWVLSRVTSVLAELGIEAMQVTIGEPFNGDRHRRADERRSSLPSGSILEVTRRGYCQLVGGEHVTIRPAEVVVSTAAGVGSLGAYSEKDEESSGGNEHA